MENSTMNYRAYLSNGEILECNNFSVLYRSARLHIRDDGTGAAILENIHSHKKICTMFRAFHRDFTHDMRGKKDIGLPALKAFIKAMFENDHYGRANWEAAWLE